MGLDKATRTMPLLYEKPRQAVQKCKAQSVAQEGTGRAI